MRSSDDLVEEYAAYLVGLQKRQGSTWPSHQSAASPAARTSGPFGLHGAGEGSWAEPMPSADPSRTDLLALLADGVWDEEECDPALVWIDERFPRLRSLVDSAGTVLPKIDWYMHLEEVDTTFLQAVERTTYRPEEGQSQATRVTTGDDLVGLAKVLAVSEAYANPVVDEHIGVRALPGYSGSFASTLGPALAAGEVSMFSMHADGHPVATGFHRPLGSVTQLRLGCLPEARHRGFGGAILTALINDAFQRGVDTVFVERRVDLPCTPRGFVPVCTFVEVEFAHLRGLTSEQRTRLVQG